jgi:hypothetical protein
MDVSNGKGNVDARYMSVATTLRFQRKTIEDGNDDLWGHPRKKAELKARKQISHG